MRRLLLSAVAALTAGVAAAQAPPPPANSAGAVPATPDVITNPDWVERPTADQLSQAYPGIALQHNWGGQVVMRCRVAINGFVTRCSIISETPAGAGFGVATLSLAPQFRMRPPTRNGVPFEGATVQFPLTWDADGGVPSANEVRAALRAAGPQRVAGLMVSPVWSAAPTWEQVRELAPDTEGTAVVRCRVWQDGTLSECRTLTTTPAGGRLGTAAERLGRHFRVDLSNTPHFDGQVQVDVPIALTRVRPDYVARPSWATLPSGADIEAGLRSIALAASDRTARTAMDCRVDDGGALTDCRVTSATPEAAGPALLGLAPRFAVRPWTEDGYPTAGARVRLPLRYVAD